MINKFFTDAQVAAVARLHGVPTVVAHGLAADVGLELALRKERQQETGRRARWLELTGRLLEMEERL